METAAPPRRLAKSEATRRRILEAARTLFNERGTGAVSTNHIAAAAGISPGNLYYHFADKADVIRALLADYASANETSWEPSTDPEVNLERLGQNFSAAAGLAWEYRFFERELRALLRADPGLRYAYRRIYLHRVEQWVAFGERLASQGLLRRPRPPSTLRDLAMAIWLLAENWLPFLDVTGDPEDPAQVAKVGDLISVAIDPYLTAKGRRALRNASSTTAGAGSKTSDGTDGNRERRTS
jgi:AcrR family transcriptional regulator